MHSSLSRSQLCLVLALAWLLPAAARAQHFIVEPYLQAASPTGMSISWETTTGRNSVVSYGESDELEHMAEGTVTRGPGGETRFHTVRLTGLKPGTRYFYRVKSGRLKSGIYDLRTPPVPRDIHRVRIVAMADTQWDFRNRHKLRETVEDGVLRFASPNTPPSLGIDMVLIAGDVVSEGRDHRDWTEHFFAPMKKLARHVPVYAVIGNHEHNSSLYFQYFELPNNAPRAYAEHFWWRDQGNVRVVGLDSNENYRVAEQLVWLDRVLADACQQKSVDFVVAAAHHPEKSEIWPQGEISYMGLVAQRLEHMATDCKKPTVLLTGHAHGYGRGHSRDSAFTMVSVATAAGHIDHFGAYDHQVDYPEIVISEDAYGFVVLEATAGDDPTLRIQRVSRGNERRRVDNALSDEVLLYRNNQAPLTPEALSPRDDEQVDVNAAVLVASQFQDPDGDGYGATHWQVSDHSCEFKTPMVDRWTQYSNVFAGKETRKKTDEARLVLPSLRPDTNYCFRVRMRDRSLAWSDWSAPQRFRTTGQAVARLSSKSKQ